MADRDGARPFEELLGALPREREQLLPALLLAQGVLGSVPDSAVAQIAGHLRLTVNEVDGAATAYPDLRRKPVGRRLIRVCTGIPCVVRGGDRLLTALEVALGLRAGATTPDGGVTLEEAACCFACGVAPVIEIDGVCRGRVDDALVREIADSSASDGLERRGAER